MLSDPSAESVRRAHEARRAAIAGLVKRIERLERRRLIFDLAHRVYHGDDAAEDRLRELLTREEG